MIEVRPEGYVDEPGSNITINRWDMRSKFEHTMLYAIKFSLFKKKLGASF